MNQKEQLLHDIGIVSFVVTELTLYLDTHPNDKNAIEYFNHYNRMQNQMEREFSQKYYPLTVSMSDCASEWRWGSAPMPWEGGCA